MRDLLAGLSDDARALAMRVLERAVPDLGLSLVVTQGRRTPEEQAQIFEQGRTLCTANGDDVVTHARAGESPHDFGLAFDVAVQVDGRPTWPEDDALWHRVGALGKSLGLAWGGDFPGGRRDRPHFELPGWQRIAKENPCS